ncbi:MAG: alpha/beta hydrolase [Ilumatobacteraceae bacterium]|nr:alpha/beta hydrolase [Ilumatobacteraceae bacterium]
MVAWSECAIGQYIERCRSTRLALFWTPTAPECVREFRVHSQQHNLVDLARGLSMDPLIRNNVHVSGLPDGQPIVFAHGFGCDQHMWRFVTEAFADRFSVVCFDHVGAGDSDRDAYDCVKYSTLDGYATDLLEICAALDLREVILVGHSVSATIAALAAIREPSRFARLVMVGPSPRYIDDVDYVGGFSEADIGELLDSLASNYLGWSTAMAPVIIGNPDRPELGEELTTSFCRTDPVIAESFARVTFLSDNRRDLPFVPTPTLVLQSRHDAIAPIAVGEYVARAIPNGSLVVLDATGHCPHLSAPTATAAAILAFIDDASLG